METNSLLLLFVKKSLLYAVLLVILGIAAFDHFQLQNAKADSKSSKYYCDHTPRTKVPPSERFF